MEKLKQLFKQAGVSEALSESIIEEIALHDKAVKEDYDRRFQERLAKAESVCKNLVNKEKVRLAKKVAVYLEAKSAHVDRTAEKLRLNEDTEATSKLKRVRALLEGINLDDPGQNRELQAARKQIARMQQAVSTLREERNALVTKANQANEIAVKHLKKSRILESQLKAATTLNESKTPSKPAAKPKPKAKPTRTVNEGKTPQRRRRLDEGRRAPERGKSSRPIHEANQTRTSSKTSKSDSTIASIASSMEDLD